MRTTSATRLRALRGAIMALGFAVLLAACQGALFVPGVATAAPARAQASSATVEVAQVDPAEPDPGDIQIPDSGDEEDNSDTGDVETPVPGQPEGKAYPVEPDSLVKAKAEIPPAGGAAFDTLKVGTTGAAAPRKPVPGTSPQQQKSTILGLHPAIFFVGFLVAHMFVVKAVSG